MTIKLRKSFICGIRGKKLSKNEYNFIKKHKPWGIILFQRNIKNINQTNKLVKSIKKIFKDSNYPVLIDEEGGRVSRLKSIIDNMVPIDKLKIIEILISSIISSFLFCLNKVEIFCAKIVGRK